MIQPLVKPLYYMSRLNYLREMPFYGLSDFQLIWENETCKEVILEKMTNNGFIDFIKNSHSYSDENISLEHYRYFDVDDYMEILKKGRQLNLIHLNCRMISKNKGKILSFLNSLDTELDVILLSEIGKEGYRYLKSVFPNYDYEVDLPKGNTYGGVEILAKTELKMTINKELQFVKECNCTRCHTENVWVEIKCQDSTIIVGCIYRHPNGNIEHFINQFSKTLEKLPIDCTCINGGDLNIDLLNIKHKDVMSYITELSSHNFLPKILLPTRITDSSYTLIDHMSLKLSKKYRDLETTAGCIFAEITDHLPIFISLSFKSNVINKRPMIRIINDRSVQNFKTKCSNLPWDRMNEMPHVDDKFNFLQDNLVSTFNETFPLVQKSRKRNKDKKWMTHALRTSIRHKNRLYRKKILYPTFNNINRFKEYNKILAESLKIAEENYYQNLFNDTKDSSIRMWKTLGSIINPNKTQKRKQINKLIIDGINIDDRDEISNQMNRYFCTLGSKLANDLPNGKSFDSYLNNKVQHTMFLTPIMESEITSEILKLNSRKSAGPDNLSPKILKACEPEIRKPLTEIFNWSFETATYPSKLKIAKVLALYKKKSAFLPENYRPISLLSCLDKIFEKLIHKRFMEFINKYKILILEQYGFLKHHSTMSALIDVIDNVRDYIDKGEVALGIYLDLKKAFDTVNHSILLSKFEHYGFRGHVNEFIGSYLNNRQQFTIIDGSKSDIMFINTGVPQGSVLGPLFFLIYINDIIKCLSYSKATLFADDTSLLLHDKSIKIVKEKAEVDLKNVYDWLLANKLSLSWEKTNFIIFHTPKNRKKVENVRELKVYDFSIKRVNCVKYLGMFIDEQLKWDVHVNNLCSTLSRNFHMFYSIRDILNSSLKRQLYFSMVYSRIIYGIVIYGACRSSLMNKVQVLQNKLLKVLHKLPFRTDTNVMHIDLDILKVKDIYKYQIQKFVYESLNKKCIVQFHDYYTYIHNVHQVNTRQQKQLHRTITNTKYGEHSLKDYGAFLWNQLESDIKCSESLDIFKKALRKSIIKSYQNLII